MVTHQLQVERRTGKVRRPETDVLPLSHVNILETYALTDGQIKNIMPTRSTGLAAKVKIHKKIVDYD